MLIKYGCRGNVPPPERACRGHATGCRVEALSPAAAPPGHSMREREVSEEKSPACFPLEDGRENGRSLAGGFRR